MRIAINNIITGSSLGVGEELIELEHEWTQARITINGLTDGQATVRARPIGGADLEPVAGGSIPLATERTLTIGSITGEGIRLDQIGITVTAVAPYSYYIMQL